MTAVGGALSALWFGVSRRGDGGAALVGLLFVGPVVAVWMISVAALVRAARYGRRPTVLTVSATRLILNCPHLSADPQRYWPRNEVVSIRLDPAGGRTGACRFLRVQVVTNSGQVSAARVPWRGAESVAELEDGLRTAMGLPPRVAGRGRR
jgi:hypothetical protein